MGTLVRESWFNAYSPLVLLHFLESIFNCFADFATDFGNGNIMSESRQIAELNRKALVRALTVTKAFCNHINLHPATMLPIVISTWVLDSGLACATG